MKKRTAGKLILVFMLLLPMMAIAHYIVFPQESRCILLPFSGLNKSGNIYYKNITQQKMQQVLEAKSAAENKAAAFWKTSLQLDYTMVFCNNETEFSKYASPFVPAATNLKMGAYIIIKDESIDENIIAHEISHTVLYRNIGWYKRTFEIPAWFDEGLAMQVDDREYYSIDSLLAKQKAGIKLPDVRAFRKMADMFDGDHAAVMLNYATSKYVIHEWLKDHSLKNFIAAINRGESFDNAYALKDK
jgi:hypothetical protein